MTFTIIITNEKGEFVAEVVLKENQGITLRIGKKRVTIDNKVEDKET